MQLKTVSSQYKHLPERGENDFAPYLTGSEIMLRNDTFSFQALCRADAGNSDREICVFIGDTIGHKRICRFPTIKTGALRLEVTDSDGEFRLRAFRAYGE